MEKRDASRARVLRREGDTPRRELGRLRSGRLYELVRERGPAPDAEQTIRALERALEVARGDPALLEHLLVATVALVAAARDETPRTILEKLFRRAVSDDEWRDRYVPVLG